MDEKGCIGSFCLRFWFHRQLQLSQVCVSLPTHPLSIYSCHLPISSGPGTYLELILKPHAAWHAEEKLKGQLILVSQSVTLLKPSTSLAPSSFITLATLAYDILKLPSSSWQKMTSVIAISLLLKQVNFAISLKRILKILTKTKPALKMMYPLFS